MGKNGGFSRTLITQQGDSTALVSSSTATSILNTQAVYTIPANDIDTTGTKFRIHASGRISTLNAAPGTLTLDVRFGAVIVFTGPAFALNTTAQTNATWELLLNFTARTVGGTTTATVLGTGLWWSRAVIGSAALGAGGIGCLPLPDTAPAAGTGFDSTSGQAVNLFAKWGTSDAANSIQTHEYSLELIY